MDSNGSPRGIGLQSMPVFFPEAGSPMLSPGGSGAGAQLPNNRSSSAFLVAASASANASSANASSAYAASMSMNAMSATNPLNMSGMPEWTDAPGTLPARGATQPPPSAVIAAINAAHQQHLHQRQPSSAGQAGNVTPLIPHHAPAHAPPVLEMTASPRAPRVASGQASPVGSVGSQGSPVRSLRPVPNPDVEAARTYFEGVRERMRLVGAQMAEAEAAAAASAATAAAQGKPSTPPGGAGVPAAPAVAAGS